MWPISQLDTNQYLPVLYLMATATALAVASYFIARFIILRLAVKLLFHSGRNHGKAYSPREIRIVRRLAKIAPILVYFLFSKSAPMLEPRAITAIQAICGILFVVNIAIVVSDLLDAISEKHFIAKHRSIKGYIQIAKLVVAGVAIILIIATLSNKSPIIILSSLGAVAAILMLVFQHTLISLVANIQVSSSSVIQIDDWIEIPQLDISGEVIDIALHTITIRNWDNTVSRVPTKNFITESYTNWQPMFASGGRRIKRSFFVDQSSIAFANPTLLDTCEPLLPISPGLRAEFDAITHLSDISKTIRQGITNLSLFRKHVVTYLQGRSDINQSLYLVVRQLPPTANGLPIEIYCFTRSTQWTEYEEAQASIFEYIFAVAPYFDLVIFQNPSGKDIHALSALPRRPTVGQ
ncbi:mechanosensitive ion channel family protein [Pseudomonas putida]|uniref:mechanosensitive ion channel family protein n=1 Tax=Pseudomonas putida TaxID=303 RepID=UPI003906C4F8